MYSKLCYLFVLLQLILSIEVKSQSFRTVQNGNWNTTEVWARNNMCGAGSYPFPPPSGGYWPACEINVSIRNTINYNLGTEFGAGYFKSLNIEENGGLNFPANFTVTSAGSNVGGFVVNISDNSKINVNGTTTLRSNALVNLSKGSQINTMQMVIEGSSRVFVDENSKISASGNLVMRANTSLRITGSSSVEVENLTLEGANVNIYVEEGSKLLVRNLTNMPQGPNSINVEGHFSSARLTITGGLNRLNVSNNGTVYISNNVFLDGDGRIVLTDEAGVVIGGTLTVTNSGGSGTTQQPNTDLIVLSPGSSFAINPNKIPNGGCFQSPENGNVCESNACVQTIDLYDGLEVVYIFRCSGTWYPPEGLLDYTVLVVGGGGAGGNTVNGVNNSSGGGGGGGATVYQLFTLNEPGLPSGESHLVTVGNGGLSNSATNAGKYGQSSSYSNNIITINAAGGAGGATNQARNGLNGVAGSSGGGAGSQANNNEGTGGNGSNNPFTNVNGNNGGDSFSSGNSSRQWGGGGGGAGSAGADVTNSNARGGAGGLGYLSLITGSPVRYAAGGGGGGSTETNRYGIAGIGGGGDGGDGSREALPGQVNSGGGGGGAGGFNKPGGNGGSGVVIIQYEVARILPVNYSHFEIEYSEERNITKLSWGTYSEKNNSGFIIERALDSELNWEEIGFVASQGNSGESSFYNFEDNNIPLFKNGRIYYRLNQVEDDGDRNYSEVKSIQIVFHSETTQAWKVFPNPTDGGRFNLALINREIYNGEEIEVKLYSSGMSIGFFSGKDLPILSQNIQQELHKSSNGVYILEIRWAQNIQHIKILKN